jgi:uncharacterized protein (TIGR03083 family)
VNAVSRSTSVGFVEDFAAAAERFAVAVGWSDLRAPVAACPGWSVYDVVVHLGNVHAWAATIVETGHRAAEHEDEPSSTRPRAVSEWYFAKAEDLYQVLRQTPSESPTWNFVDGEGVARFWQRRQLHETTVHHVDLDIASGRRIAISPGVATDGVGEVLEVLLRRMLARGHAPALEAPLRITATDTGDTWLVVPQEPPLAPRVEHRAASTAPGSAVDRVEAPAAVLYRALWHRRVDERDLQVTGSATRVHAFLGSRLTP